MAIGRIYLFLSKSALSILREIKQRQPLLKGPDLLFLLQCKVFVLSMFNLILGPINMCKAGRGSNPTLPELGSHLHTGLVASNIKLLRNAMWQKISTWLRACTVTLHAFHHYYCCLHPRMVIVPTEKSQPHLKQKGESNLMFLWALYNKY